MADPWAVRERSEGGPRAVRGAVRELFRGRSERGPRAVRGRSEWRSENCSEGGPSAVRGRSESGPRGSDGGSVGGPRAVRQGSADRPRNPPSSGPPWTATNPAGICWFWRHQSSMCSVREGLAVFGFGSAAARHLVGIITCYLQHAASSMLIEALGFMVPFENSPLTDHVD